MLPSSIASEAWRNVISGTTHAVRYAMLLTLIIATTGMVELLPIIGLIARANEFQQSGGATIVYEARNQIDPMTCDSLISLEGVLAAGALQARETPITALALPAAAIPVFNVTPGALGLFTTTGDLDNLGVILSDDAATTLGINPGDTLATSEGDIRVSAVYSYPDDGRRPGMGYAMLVPTLSRDLMDECWVASWPQNDNIANYLPMTLYYGNQGDSATRPVMGQLNTSLGRTFDGYYQFQHRPLRYAVVLNGVIAFGIGLLSVFTRRLELAAAQHAGVTQLQQIIQLVGEALVWITLGTIFSITVLGVYANQTALPDSAALWRIISQLTFVAVICALSGVVIGAALIKESQLFRYFKAR